MRGAFLDGATTGDGSGGRRCRAARAAAAFWSDKEDGAGLDFLEKDRCVQQHADDSSFEAARPHASPFTSRLAHMMRMSVVKDDVRRCGNGRCKWIQQG